MLDTNPDIANQADLKAFLLISLRKAVLRCDIDKNELQSIGTALNHDWITVEGAMSWLSDLGLASQVIPDHEATS
jgi:hypothetical protein